MGVFGETEWIGISKALNILISRREFLLLPFFNQYHKIMNDTTEYRKYVELCRSLDLEPYTFNEWKYCTYSGFEGEWRIRQAEQKKRMESNLQKGNQSLAG